MRDRADRRMRPLTIGVGVGLAAGALVGGGLLIGQSLGGGSVAPTAPPTPAAVASSSSSISAPTTPAPDPAPASSSSIVAPGTLTLTFATSDLAATDGYDAGTFTTARAQGGAPGVAERMNRTLTSVVDGLLAETQARRAEPPPPDAGFLGWTEQRLEEVPCRPGLLCLRMMWDEMPPGAMMHVAQYQGLVFDSSTGARVRLLDILTPAQAERVMPAVVAEFIAQEPGLAGAASEPDLAVVTKNDAWLPLEEGLWVFVHEYALGPFPFQTIIPWPVLGVGPTP